MHGERTIYIYHCDRLANFLVTRGKSPVTRGQLPKTHMLVVLDAKIYLI
jgi:hypothetical protein